MKHMTEFNDNEPSASSADGDDVDCLEIWAVGGDDWIQQSLQDQQKERDIAIANLRRNLRVDKKHFIDDFRGGKLLGKTNPLFEHNNHTMDRPDF